MKSLKKPNFAKAVLVALLLPGALFAFTLEDISLSPGAQVTLKLSFARSAGESEYPLYFQKADPSRGTLTLSFLDTETSFPLGRHAVEPANAAVEEILLKRITSPSGKEFLGVELRLREPPMGEAPVQPQPKGALKVMLGKGVAVPGKAKPWSLAKAMKAREEYLNAKAEPPPREQVPNKVEAQPADPAPAAPAAEPPASDPAGATPPAQGAAPAAPEAAPAPEAAALEGAPAVLKEIRMAVTPSQEDVSLILEPAGAAPAHTAQAAADDSTALELTLEGVTSALPRKEYALPGSGLFRRVKASQRNGDLVLRFQRVSADPVHILPQEGGLTLTGAGKGDAAVPFKWTSSRPDAAPAPASAAGAEPVKSAHVDGASVDAAAGISQGGPSGRAKSKGLSSSRVFSLGKGGKGMVNLKDSAALRANPNPKAGVKKKLPIGEKVERVEREGAWLKVISGGDTGWVRAIDAAYEDEMSEAQLARLRKDMEAVAARIEAQRAKAEQLAAKEAAAAEAAAQAAQARPAPAEAGDPAIIEEAEPVRVAGPGVAPASKAEQAEASAAANPKGRKASDGPKLSLAETPELADKLAQEKKAAEEEKMRVEPSENRVAYNSYGRRDPFIPVEQGMTDNGIDIDQMKVVGIIWQAQEPMAVLEHNKESGVSFTVKQGDPVHNGRVSRITRDQVTFDISEYGISRSYSLKLVSNKEGKKQP